MKTILNVGYLAAGVLLFITIIGKGHHRADRRAQGP